MRSEGFLQAIMDRPTPDDIRAAITQVETGEWLDPSVTPVCWSCDLYDPDGVKVVNAQGHTAAEAARLAWVCAMAPDALSEAYVDHDEVPLEIPDNWRFELTAPREVGEDGAAIDRRPYLPYEEDQLRRVLGTEIERNPDAVSISERLLQALEQRGPVGRTIEEISREKVDPADIVRKRKQHGPSSEAIAEVLLRKYRIPLAMEQAFIRHGLAGEVRTLLDDLRNRAPRRQRRT
jgi:hypothetical protein